MSSLRQQAAHGVMWSALESFAHQFSYFVVQVALARLLAPEHFGLIAMVGVFTAVSLALMDVGMGPALIQQEVVGPRDLGTVLSFNLGMSVVLMGGLWLLAPHVATFYRQDLLADILRALSIVVVINAAGTVHAAMLNRELRFRHLFWVTVPSVLISGVIGILCAVKGLGAWSLVVVGLTQAVLKSAALWWKSGHRVELCLDREVLRRLLPFGSRMAASSIIDRLFADLYVLVIGRMFTPVDVGIFQRAHDLQRLPASNLQSIINRVAYPLLSAVKNDPVRLHRGMQLSGQLGGVAAIPLFAGIAVSAEPLIEVVLGTQWLTCAPLLQLLCIPGALYTLHATNLNLLMAVGRSDLFLRIEVFKKFLTLLNVVLLARYGVQALVVGMACVSCVALIINTRYSRRFAGYGPAAQLRDLLPVFLIAFGMAVAAKLALFLSSGSCALVRLALSIVTGFGVMLMSLRWLPRELRVELNRQVASHARIATLVRHLMPAP